MRRLWRTLRSRKLAIWLLVASAAYQSIAISVPALGRESFSSPGFLAVAVLLGLSTAACAWERSAHALRLLREPAGVPATVIDRLRRQPVVASVNGDVEGVRPGVKEALRGIGLRVQGAPTVLRGRANRVGPIGSPLFHWALALLFLVVPLGRLSRSEGLIGVPQGAEGVFNEAAEYGRLSRGPLYLDRYNGVRLHVPELREFTRPDGLEVGLVPRVRVLDGAGVLADGDVYANHPLRFGTVLVHFDDWGFFGRFEILDAEDLPIADTTAFFDIAADGKIQPAVVTLTSGGGVKNDVTIVPKARSEGASSTAKRQVSISWRSPSGDQTSTVLPVGETTQVADASVRFVEAGRYARLSFVDDWSVYPIYLLLTIAIVGLSIAILAPRRTAWVLLEQREDGVALRVLAAHDRSDPGFGDIVAARLRALEAPRETEMT